MKHLYLICGTLFFCLLLAGCGAGSADAVSPVPASSAIIFQPAPTAAPDSGSGLPHPMATAEPVPSAGATQAPSSQAAAALRENWDGTYCRDAESASAIELVITDSSASGFSFSLSLKGEELDGTASATGAAEATYRENGYTAIFSLSDGTITLTENAAYSPTLSFAGTYPESES